MFADFLNFFTFGFSEKFAIKHLSCLLLHILHYRATKLKMQFYHCSCYKYVRRNSFIFTLCNSLSDKYYHNILLTQQQLPVMCEICCEFFIFQRNNMSAKWVRTAVSVSPIWAFWNGRHSTFTSSGTSTQIWTHWTTKFALKFSSCSFSEKFITWTDRHYGMAGMALSNASSTTLQTSDINVSECVFM